MAGSETIDYHRTLHLALCCFFHKKVAQLSGATEFIDCISAGVRTPNEYPVDDAKQSDSKVPVMQEL